MDIILIAITQVHHVYDFLSPTVAHAAYFHPRFDQLGVTRHHRMGQEFGRDPTITHSIIRGGSERKHATLWDAVTVVSPASVRLSAENTPVS